MLLKNNSRSPIQEVAIRQLVLRTISTATVEHYFIQLYRNAESQFCRYLSLYFLATHTRSTIHAKKLWLLATTYPEKKIIITIKVLKQTDLNVCSNFLSSDIIRWVKIQNGFLTVTYTYIYIFLLSSLGNRKFTKMKSSCHHLIRVYTYMNARYSRSWNEVLQNIHFW